MADQTATDIIARWGRMKADRSSWDILWDTLAKYIMPRKGNILTKLTPGQDQTIDLYDSTAEEAAGVFAAGTMTHIMPAGEKWARVESDDPDAPDEIRAGFDELTDRVMQLIHTSNFYLTAHEDLLDDGIFGTSLWLLEPGKKHLLNFINIPVGTFAVSENAEGMVDTVGREWKWTARQAAQFWGREALGKQQQEALTSKNPTDCEKQFTYVHLIEPRDDSGYAGGPVSGTKRPIRSIYVCLEDQQVIAEGGYYTMPALCSRLLRSNNEVYGRSCGMACKSEVLVVNAMERDLLVWIEKMGNPPWLQPDDSASAPDNRPGGVTYWDATNPNNKPEQLEPKGRVDLAEMKTEQKRNRIRSAFYNDLFKMLTTFDEVKRQKTAYEVQQMVYEKLILFSPIFARYVTEKLNPTFERIVDMMARAGMLPVALQGIPGLQYKVTYVSKIALAIKAASTQSYVQMLQLVEAAAAIDPAARNVLDVVEGLRMTGANLGVPAKLLRSNRDVQRITAAQQAEARAAQAAATAEMTTRSVKNMGPEAQREATEAMANA